MSVCDRIGSYHWVLEAIICMRKALFIIHTGNGKGKTTAALGLAFRALGHGQKVCFIQFVKGTWKPGELFAAGRFADLLEFHVLGKGFIRTAEEAEKQRDSCLEAWEFAKRKLSCGEFTLVVLDELLYLIHYKVITDAEILEALRARPEGVHVVVTGRGAPQALVDAADLVTEMKEIKHPFKNGIKAQKGIEF